MARRSRTQITREGALTIASKLDAKPINVKSAAHDQYGVFHGERLLATFGIRRSPRKDQGHDYIPAELHIRPHFAKQIVRCTKYRNDYLIEIGAIPETDETDENAD